MATALMLPCKHRPLTWPHTARLPGTTLQALEPIARRERGGPGHLGQQITNRLVSPLCRNQHLNGRRPPKRRRAPLGPLVNHEPVLLTLWRLDGHALIGGRTRWLDAAPHHNRKLSSKRGRRLRRRSPHIEPTNRGRHRKHHSRAVRIRRIRRRVNNEWLRATGKQQAHSGKQGQTAHVPSLGPRYRVAMTTDVRSWPHRRAFALAWPAILSNISVPLVGLIDTAMLGHFSDEANLGAAALGSAVLGAVFWLLSFLRTGTTSLVGRALGAKRPDAALTHAQRSALLAAGLGIGILAIQWAVVPVVMRLLTPNDALADMAASFTSIRLASAPAVLLTLVIAGWFIGAGDTRRPLAVVITIGSLNVILDLLFVAGLGLGADGAAVATAIAEWAGFALAVMLWWRSVGDATKASARRWKGRGLRSGWRAVLVLNRDIFLRTGVLYIVLTFVTAYGAHISSTVLAANAILMQLMLLASYGQDGYAHAAESLAAREIGAKDVPAFHRAVGAAAAPAVAIGAVFTALYWFGGDAFIAILTSLPDVTAAAQSAMPWVAVLPLVSAAAYLFDGVFLGSGKVRWMLLSMSLSALVFFFVWWLGATTEDPAARNANLWSAFLVFNVCRGVFLGIAYSRLTRSRGWLASAEA
jgi:MATE family multidrug resistance protein